MKSINTGNTEKIVVRTIRSIAREIAKAFLALGEASIEGISRATNVPLDEVKALAASMGK